MVPLVAEITGNPFSGLPDLPVLTLENAIHLIAGGSTLFVVTIHIVISIMYRPVSKSF